MNDLTFHTAYKQLGTPERAFVDAFVRECEIAARQAGKTLKEFIQDYDPSGLPYSQLRMIERQIVRAAIVERIEQITIAGELSVDRWIKEVATIAFASMGDYLSNVIDDPEPKIDMSNCTPEQLAAIAGYDYEQGRAGIKIKIKLHDKLRALEMYGKFVGAMADDVKPNAPVTGILPLGISEQNAADIYARMIEHE